MPPCQICTKGIHVTKRDMFYTDVKLFKKQTESDDVLEEAAAMLGCTRASLNGVAHPSICHCCCASNYPRALSLLSQAGYPGSVLSLLLCLTSVWLPAAAA